MKPNKFGMTPLRLAAEYLNDECVNYLINDYGSLSNLNMLKPLCKSDPQNSNYKLLTIFNQHDLVEAYELLAAGFTHDHAKQDIVKAKYFFLKAIRERLKYSNNINIGKICKELSEPNNHNNQLTKCHPLFGERVESITLNDYNNIINDLDELYIETLMILERINGPYHSSYSMKLKNLGARYAKNAEFYKCLPFWIYSLEVDFVCGQCLNETLLKLIRIFSQMLTLDIDFKFDDFFVLLIYCEKSLVNNLTLLKSTTIREPKTDSCKLLSQIESTLLVLLYTVQLFTVFETNLSPSNGCAFKQKLYDIIKLDARATRGQALLHFATDADTKVDEFFYMDELCKNPDPDTVDLLIRCGADVDAQDDLGNTALHLAVVDLWSYNFPSSLRIVLALVKADAHLDYFNHEGFSLLEDHGYPYDNTENFSLSRPARGRRNGRSRQRNGIERAVMPRELHRSSGSSSDELPEFQRNETESDNSDSDYLSINPTTSVVGASHSSSSSDSPNEENDDEETNQIDYYFRNYNRDMSDIICEEESFAQFPPIFSQVEVSLKCLAARCVRKHGIHYTSKIFGPRDVPSLVPEAVKIFLDRHGPKSTNKTVHNIP